MLLLLCDHLIAGIQEGFNLAAAVFRADPFGCFPDGEPQQHGVKKHRRDRLAHLDSSIGIVQARLDELENNAIRIGPQYPVRPREKIFEQAEFSQAIEAGGGVAGMEQLEGFVVNPCRGNLAQQLCQFADGPGRPRRKTEAQFRGQPRCPKHPDRVLAVPDHRVPDQPQGAAGNIVHPGGVIPDAKVGDIVIKRVDREIPAPDIFVDGAVYVVAKNSATVGVLAVFRSAALR